MNQLTHHDIAIFFLALGTLLAVARLLGETAMRFHQPAVLGEILAGVLLGPTVLGSISPDMQSFLFPREGLLPVVMQGLTTLAITLFLLVAGMEVDLSSVWRQGRAAISISFFGMVIPFSLGFVLAWFFTPFFGVEAEANRFIFSLFMGTALSISALPVIARTMMDLNLYRTDLGMLIISAAVVNDIAGWIIFAVILGMIGAAPTGGMLISQTIFATIAFAVLILTVGRWLLDRVLPWLQAHTSWPGGILGFALSCALLCAAFTEWIGIHAIFGAFLFGVALGDSRHLRERTRATIDQFVSFFFAPLFFGSIGLTVNFATHFDLGLIIVVVVIAIAGKVLGCFWGGRLSGLGHRESWAIGFGMNSRGAMEIILGMLALQSGVIRERTFVALVVMALVTSMMSGSMIQRILKTKKAARFFDFFPPKNFRQRVESVTRRNVIAELCQLIAEGTNMDARLITEQVLDREDILPSGLDNWIAIPHARIEKLPAPVVAVGFSEEGIDFDSPDGQNARLVVLILTPAEDDSIQLELISDVLKTFSRARLVEKTVEAKTFTEFLAVAKSGSLSLTDKI